MSSNHEGAEIREIEEAKLTAYALGQLDARERGEVEALLLRSESARRFVRETTDWADQVREAYRSGPLPEPSPGLREVLENELKRNDKSQIGSRTMSTTVEKTKSRKKILIGLGVAGIAGVAVCVGFVLVIPSLLLRAPAQVAQRLPDSAATSEKAGAEKHEYRFAESKPSEPAKAGVAMQTSEQSAKPLLGRQESRKDLDESKSVSVGKGWKYKPNQSDAAKPANRLARRESTASSDAPALSAKPDVAVVKNYAMPSPSPLSVVPPPSESPAAEPNFKSTASKVAEPQRQIGLKSDSNALAKGKSEESILANQPLSSLPAVTDGIAPIELKSGLVPSDNYSTLAEDTEQYDPIFENSFVSVAQEPVTTFSIDVDTASYANVRRFLREGWLPPPNAVRIEEMLNYFSYDYSPPTDGTPFSVNLETAECPWKPEHRLIRVGLKGREIDRSNRGAGNLVFLLDVSGSMNEPNKLPLVKEAMKLLVGQLAEDDRVAIVTYASDTRVALPSARGNEREKIAAAIDALQAGGSTYGSGGIQLAYQQAAEHFVKGGTNRVILCTDGDLNVGVTRDEDLVELIEQKAKSGVFLTVLGFGEGNLKDSKMQKLADKGNGIYAYVDCVREARRVLVEQMTGSLMTIAKDVKLQIEFNPAAVGAYRLIGYEKRKLANQDFNDDRKDAGEIGAGHTVTALYEIEPAGSPDAARSILKDGDVGGESSLKYQQAPRENLTPAAQSGELLTLKIRYKEPDKDTSKLLEFTAKDDGRRFGEASADFRFAASVASFGMMLRSSPYRGNLTYAAVAEFAAGALGKDANGYRAEFLDLVRGAEKLSTRPLP
jgi:secreted protein with Ig-like and vWFA domain